MNNALDEFLERVDYTKLEEAITDLAGLRLALDEARKVIDFVMEDSIIMEDGRDACENCKYHGRKWLKRQPRRGVNHERT